MQTHEYRVVPAPRRGVKAKGARTAEERLARAVEGEMNRMARDGWEFVRADTLPSEERQGLFGGRATVFQTLLVYRRPLFATAAAEQVPAPVARIAGPASPVLPPPLQAPPPAATPPAATPYAAPALAAEPLPHRAPPPLDAVPQDPTRREPRLAAE